MRSVAAALQPSKSSIPSAIADEVAPKSTSRTKNARTMLISQNSFMSHAGPSRAPTVDFAYVSGLVGPGDRKSIQPMAERLAPGDYDQLHHFIATGVRDAAPLERELLVQADRLVGAAMRCW
jgi:hypothetical protein